MVENGMREYIICYTIDATTPSKLVMNDKVKKNGFTVTKEGEETRKHIDSVDKNLNSANLIEDSLNRIQDYDPIYKKFNGKALHISTSTYYFKWKDDAESLKEFVLDGFDKETKDRLRVLVTELSPSFSAHPPQLKTKILQSPY